MKTMCLFHLFVAAYICVLLPRAVHSVCWETRCLLDTWAVRRCEQYGMFETGKRRCYSGLIYRCCDNNNKVSSKQVSTGSGSRRGELTWYNLGLTACGQVYSDNDMVAALAFSHFTTPNPNNDPMCGRQIEVVDPSTQKMIRVTVVDKCGGCSENDVDVSMTAFQKFKPLGVGRFKIKWAFH